MKDSRDNLVRTRQRILLIAILAVFFVVTKIVLPNNAHKAKMELLKTASVGDTVCFGTYEQDNDTTNGAETIEWQVLAKENNKLLVISKYGLDSLPFNASYEDMTWENCTLREWLNRTFLDSAFNANEKSVIDLTSVTADENPEYDKDPGNDTTEKIFLLSVTEANKYFSSDSARQCRPTAFAIANGIYETDKCWWWLRTPGIFQASATNVRGDGTVDCASYDVDRDGLAIRPAMWINLCS